MIKTSQTKFPRRGDPPIDSLIYAIAVVLYYIISNFVTIVKDQPLSTFLFVLLCNVDFYLIPKQTDLSFNRSNRMY